MASSMAMPSNAPVTFKTQQHHNPAGILVDKRKIPNDSVPMSTFKHDYPAWCIKPNTKEDAIFGPHRDPRDFLAQSHFRIEQDSNINLAKQISTFKSDYPPWSVTAKPKPAQPPPAGGVLNEDYYRFKNFLSETQHEYVLKDVEKRSSVKEPNKLRATNFKMDGDERLLTFDTSNKLDYPPKQTESVIWAMRKDHNPLKSYIPQGDKEKADMPLSDYKDRYRVIDVNLHRPEKAVNKEFGGRPTIQGDTRQHHYTTTHTDMYRPNTVAPIQRYPANRESHLPQGDPEKERYMRTVFQDSYTVHDLNKNQSDLSTLNKMQKTNVNLKDERLNNYVSTFKDSYKPCTVEVVRPVRNRNETDFPKGDLDPYRNAENANMTTNRFYESTKQPAEKPQRVSGANKRTKSNVQFGDPDEHALYYETTTASTYTPVTVPYNYKRTNICQSNIPTDYFSNDDNFTTYKTDFLNPEQGKLIPNDEALESLKKSHIVQPLKGERFFATEHKDQFWEKKGDTEHYDPWKLQKSSVPLGTMPY